MLTKSFLTSVPDCNFLSSGLQGKEKDKERKDKDKDWDLGFSLFR